MAVFLFRRVRLFVFAIYLGEFHENIFCIQSALPWRA